MANRQKILSQVLSFDNEDGRFDFLIGELERLSNRLEFYLEKRRQPQYKFFT